MAVTSVQKYRSAIKKHFAENKRERAVEISVGGDFVQLGDLEMNLLRMIGWETDTLDRNRRSSCFGIRGHLGPEYAQRRDSS
jgi:hypothetical protein